MIYNAAAFSAEGAFHENAPVQFFSGKGRIQKYGPKGLKKGVFYHEEK